MEKDPQETIDISNRYAEEAHRYTQNLRSWRAAQKHLLSTAKLGQHLANHNTADVR